METNKKILACRGESMRRDVGQSMRVYMRVCERVHDIVTVRKETEDVHETPPLIDPVKVLVQAQPCMSRARLTEQV